MTAQSRTMVDTQTRKMHCQKRQNPLPDAENALPEASNPLSDAQNVLPEVSNPLPDAQNALPEASNKGPVGRGSEILYGAKARRASVYVF